jgi:glycerol-3-phosphate acyltransferase PlsY
VDQNIKLLENNNPMVLIILGTFVISYIIGSIPFGFLLVKAFTGKDVREVESGRTGGTNTMRAAGFLLGFTTSLLDIIKSAGAVWIARYLSPGAFWLHVFAGLIAVMGHNYSVFLIRKDRDGKIKVGGGAGGTPAIGAIVGLWWPSIFILVPAGYLLVMVVGYASLATLSLPIIGSLILLFRFIKFDEPWEYILSGLLSEIFIVWALIPNIKRLINGTERLVGFRAKKKDREKNNKE